MGHTIAKNLYRRLGKKIDTLGARVPWSDTLHAILTQLYSSREAGLVIRMPAGLSTLHQIARATGQEGPELQKALDALCDKGLVIDLHQGDRCLYAPSPLVIGIFEFTMMRTDENLDTGHMARLFNDYLYGDDSFYRANLGGGERVALSRTLPHEGAVRPSEYVEVLDYERATALVEEADRYALGLCACRHEKLHIGEKRCSAPLEVCSSFGTAADYVIRHRFGREVSRGEMLETLQRSREAGLVFNADNVRRRVGFICHCCKCCCGMLLGITAFGYPNAVVTSTCIASADLESCIGCGVCADACPSGALSLVPSPGRENNRRVPSIDRTFCLGCGVCALKCPGKALSLVKRKARVLHPETTFERVILQSLERGTLHNLLFDRTADRDQRFLRALCGGFLRLPPVKKALMSDLLRSRFLNVLQQGARASGKGWLVDM